MILSFCLGFIFLNSLGLQSKNSLNALLKADGVIKPEYFMTLLISIKLI